MNKPIKTIGQLRGEFKRIKGVVAGDTWFMAQAMMFLCENLKPNFLKTKKKASKWSLFLGGYLRKGRSVQEASKDWRIKK